VKRRVKELVPLRVRKAAREREHAWRVSRALSRGVKGLRERPWGSETIWRDLAVGWDNERWSAGPEYLDAVAAAALGEQGPILECGSGITTLVLATISEYTGSQVLTLEQDERCFELVRSRLRRLGLEADVRLTPLRSYGEYDWYDIDPADLHAFSLVVCDGPPGATRGGRFGLLPVLRERLLPGCAILVDDAARPAEQEILRRWSHDVSLRFTVRGERPFAVVELAGSGGPSQTPL
jgi:Methyltransferase domain